MEVFSIECRVFFLGELDTIGRWEVEIFIRESLGCYDVGVVLGVLFICI